jgi:hypothetical protein
MPPLSGPAQEGRPGLGRRVRKLSVREGRSRRKRTNAIGPEVLQHPRAGHRPGYDARRHHNLLEREGTSYWPRGAPWQHDELLQREGPDDRIVELRPRCRSAGSGRRTGRRAEGTASRCAGADLRRLVSDRIVEVDVTRLNDSLELAFRSFVPKEGVALRRLARRGVK